MSPNGRSPSTIVRLAGIACLLALPGVAVPEVTLEIDGLPDPLAKNVRLSAGALPKDDPRAVRRYVRDLPTKATRALAALGYYAAEVDVEVREDGDATVIVIDAQPNDPVRVATIDIGIDGPAREDPAFMSVIPEIPLRRGAVFVSSDYTSAKTLLTARSQDLGYFDFDFPVADVRVSRRQLTADIELKAESGPRYAFGRVLFDQDAFSDSFLDRYLAFEPGDAFSVEAIADSTENLQASDFFSSVRVIPQRDARYGTEVPVRVTLVKKAPNQVALGIGYQTDIGPRFSVNWDKPLINRRGHSASANLEISRIRQTVGLAYRIPRVTDPIHDYFGIQYGLRNEDDEDTESLLSTLNFERVSRTTHEFTQSFFLRWERESSTVGGRELETDLVLPGISYARTRRKGAPFLSWGQTESFQLYGGSKELLSSIDLLKATVDFRYLRSFFERSSFIGGISLGWIESNDFGRLPVSQRFFAGGDRSIRGYGYREVSPRNIEGEAVGGRYLELFSAEYDYRFLDRWSAAIFVDTGRAFNDYDAAYSTGAGIGIRWQSPVGPFRIDIATPIDGEDEGKVRLHLSLGPEL